MTGYRINSHKSNPFLYFNNKHKGKEIIDPSIYNGLKNNNNISLGINLTKRIFLSGNIGN